MLVCVFDSDSRVLYCNLDHAVRRILIMGDVLCEQDLFFTANQLASDLYMAAFLSKFEGIWLQIE